MARAESSLRPGPWRARTGRSWTSARPSTRRRRPPGRRRSAWPCGRRRPRRARRRHSPRPVPPPGDRRRRPRRRVRGFEGLAQDEAAARQQEHAAARHASASRSAPALVRAQLEHRPGRQGRALSGSAAATAEYVGLQGVRRALLVFQRQVPSCSRMSASPGARARAARTSRSAPTGSSSKSRPARCCRRGPTWDRSPGPRRSRPWPRRDRP